jgi:dsDNA-specific endonuclease/ATPase MutS2
LTPRKKNSKSRNKDSSKDEFVDKELKEKVRRITEQKINTDEQDKAQSIIRQAEDKARSEAELRSKEITKEAEEKAQSIIRQAEEKAQSIIRQAEDKARSEPIEKKMTNQETAKIMDYYHQEGEEEVPIKLKETSYHENDNSSNLFMPGFSLWQDYAKIWMEFSKETANNTTKKVFGYFENNNEKN